MRHRPGEAVQHTALPELPPHWLSVAAGIAAGHPGTMLEAKSHGFVLHYRAAPLAGEDVHDALLALLTELPDAYVLMAAKMAWEVRPAGTDKAAAVRSLMRHAPFQGRVPVFVGDDVTDRDGIAEARIQGGIGFFVPEDFGSPSGVRAWIAGITEAAA